ncbi:hypothetical protein P8935_11385 [Telmatobacter sp. DSM 110680]|uniref:Uncharacterized protein n=1 Tax=Telmatobacter sp. DSM 110680 TaxID=3036704 RepID=A0AAU7DRG4_9BACT
MKLTVAIAFVAALFVVQSRGVAQSVDPSLVGNWEMTVPNEAGAALWVWEVRANGTYDFHAEGPGNVPSHHGIFQAAHGQYVLKAANLDWQDTGTYDPPAYGIVRMTSSRLGTGYWTQRPTAVQTPSKSSKESDSVDDMIKGLEQNGIGEDAEFGHYDKTASDRAKARNQNKIQIMPYFGAVLAGANSNKPVVLFYSGGDDINALIYSDAMAALAGRAQFGLNDENEPDLTMTNAPQRSGIQNHTFPRVLIIKPLVTPDQIIELAKQHPGQKKIDLPTLAEFEWEYLGAKSAKEWAAMISTELRKLGY